MAILMTDDCFCCWMGTKCSSWSICSRGSTLRSYLNPLGHTELLSVRQANLMVGRQGRVMAQDRSAGAPYLWVSSPPLEGYGY